MYSTAARKVASSADDAPRGGMAPLPLRATAMIESIPLAISGLQAALSHSLGALATPVLWQAMQADLYSFSPARSEEHTSELQSLMRISYAVFCSKKKSTTHITTTY